MSAGRDGSYHAIALLPRDMSSCSRIWMAASHAPRSGNRGIEHGIHAREGGGALDHGRSSRRRRTRRLPRACESGVTASSCRSTVEPQSNLEPQMPKPAPPIRSNRNPRRLLAAASLTVATVAMLAAAAVALAATPVTGATYNGTFKAGFDTVRLSFKVSSNGKRVTNLRVTDTGLYCAGGGGVTPVHFNDAGISATGTFRSTGEYRIAIGPRSGQIGEELAITGTFKTGRREGGTMKTTYTGSVSSSCSGQSSYSTKAGS